MNEDIYYTAESEYGVIALIGLVPRQEYIGGDTIMTGKFAKGEPHTISATYRVTNGASMSIGLTIKTSGADTLGGWPYYACNSWTFKEYNIAEPKVIPGKTYTDSVTGVQIRAIPGDEFKIPVTDKYGKPVLLQKAEDEYDSDHRINMDNPLPRNKIKEIPLVLNDNLAYEQTKILKVSEQSEATFIFRDINTGGILIPAFTDSVHSLGTITQKDDSTFLFEPTNKTGEINFNGEIDGRPFHLRFLMSQRSSSNLFDIY